MQGLHGDEIIDHASRAPQFMSCNYCMYNSGAWIQWTEMLKWNGGIIESDSDNMLCMSILSMAK